MSIQKLDLGGVVITTGAGDKLEPWEVRRAVERHEAGDWGEVCAEDAEANDAAARDGDRILSVYRSETGVAFWVITEWDRSLTTILLPEEY